MANSKIKIIYFDVTGRAETSRLVLAAAGKEFEDVRFSPEEWPKIKPTTPFGSCPVLELDGKKYGQSKAIASYLASEFGLYGKTNLDKLQIDQVANLMEEIIHEFAKFHYEKDEAKKAEALQHLVNEVGPKYIQYFEKLLQENGTGFVAGDSFSLGDIIVFDVCTGFLKQFVEKGMAESPLVKQLVEKVGSNERIKTYMANRKD